MTKRILALLLCLGILVSFVGCSNNTVVHDFEVKTADELSEDKIGSTGGLKLPIVDKPVTLKVLTRSSESDLNEAPVIEELRRRTGIDIDLMVIPLSVFSEKTKIMLADKNSMPDVGFYDLSEDEINDIGMNQGAFVAIDEYLDILPNAKEIFWDNAKEYNVEGALNNLKAADGHLYMFPTYNLNRAVNTGFLYRKDIFDKHGLKADWSGPEEFYQVLKKLKQLYPNSYPFSSKMRLLTFSRFAESWGIGTAQGDGYDFSVKFFEDRGKWEYSGISPEFKDMVNFLKRLYNEKLMDPEIFTVTDNAWTTKFTQPEYSFVTADWIGRMELLCTATKDTVPGYDLRYAPPPGPTGKVPPYINYGVYNVITNNDKKEFSLKLCDYLLSESGAELTTLGVRDEMFTDGEDRFASYELIKQKEGTEVTTTILEKYGVALPGLTNRRDNRSIYFKFSEREQEAQDMMLNKEDGFEKHDPKLIFNEEEKAIRTQYMSQMAKASEEFLTKYLLNESYGEKEWNEYVAKIKSLGHDKVIKAYESAYERYMNK